MRRRVLALSLLCLAGCGAKPPVKDGLSESDYISDRGVYATPKPRGLSAQEAATDKNVIGCVKVEYLVRPDGTAGEVRILHSEPAGYFDARVLRAMEQIRFQPRSAIAFATRTFSFAPSQSREVLASAAALCEQSRPQALPPPPEGGLIEQQETKKSSWFKSSSKPSAEEAPRRPTGRKN